ncbi:male accessory gland serine protease inhibitor-like [Drosophila subobscura]|uniref:male accessory gland serine protease inhibitor-like n=1 Tax=Drosophila subobscura TaxID=7241 RepID=UPI00155A92B3|nr:male accessory gland serine protease inhibitor-like [Drosophila subobscura]
MKFLAIFGLIFALLGLTLALKDPDCGLDAGVDGNGLIKCAAFVPSWTYQADSNECTEFVFGGCGGNANRFVTQAECEEKCKE